MGSTRRLILAMCVATSFTSPSFSARPNPYEAIDKHSLKATAEAEATVPLLAKYLVEPCKTEKEKTRAIYRWITDRIAYDIDGLLSGKRLDGNAATVLKTRLAVCEGYANLFRDLAIEAGLRTEIIDGYAKGIDFVPEKDFDKANHAWTAVKLDDRWQLIDSTWGAGAIDGKKFVERFSELYFLISPEKLIFTHLPSDPKWQLQKEKLTLKEFERQPKVDPGFFKLGVPIESIRKTIGEKSFRELAKLYDFPGDSTTFEKGPLDRFLKVDEEYTFVIRSEDFIQMAVFLDGKAQAMTKEGATFSAEIKAPKGKIQIGGNKKKDDPTYELILEYVGEKS